MKTVNEAVIILVKNMLLTFVIRVKILVKQITFLLLY